MMSWRRGGFISCVFLSWMKVFTAFYVLVGIGILVEVARQLGFAMIEVRQQDHAAKAAAKAAKRSDESG
jgi:hypothetical protein